MYPDSWYVQTPHNTKHLVTPPRPEKKGSRQSWITCVLSFLMDLSIWRCFLICIREEKWLDLPKKKKSLAFSFIITWWTFSTKEAVQDVCIVSGDQHSNKAEESVFSLPEETKSSTQNIMNLRATSWRCRYVGSFQWGKLALGRTQFLFLNDGLYRKFMISVNQLASLVQDTRLDQSNHTRPISPLIIWRKFLERNCAKFSIWLCSICFRWSNIHHYEGEAKRKKNRTE